MQRTATPSAEPNLTAASQFIERMATDASFTSAEWSPSRARDVVALWRSETNASAYGNKMWPGGLDAHDFMSTLFHKKNASPHELVFSAVKRLQSSLQERPDVLFAPGDDGKALRLMVVGTRIEPIRSAFSQLAEHAMHEPELLLRILKTSRNYGEHDGSILHMPVFHACPGLGIAFSLSSYRRDSEEVALTELALRDASRLSAEQLKDSVHALISTVTTKQPQLSAENAIHKHLSPFLPQYGARISGISDSHVRDAAVARLGPMTELLGPKHALTHDISSLAMSLMHKKDTGSICRGMLLWVGARSIQNDTREQVLARTLELAEDQRPLIGMPLTEVTGRLLESLPSDHPKRDGLLQILLTKAQSRHGPSRKSAGAALAVQANLTKEDTERFILALKNKPLSAAMGMQLPLIERFIDGCPKDLHTLLGGHLQIGLLQASSARSPTDRMRAGLTLRAAHHLERFIPD